MIVCPHCGPLHDGMCRLPDGSIDRRAWTQAERDERDARLQRRDPTLRFAPSTAQMQDRFGARNRAEREH